MSTLTRIGASPVLLLDGKLAEDLMTANIVSIPRTATIAEGSLLLMEKDLHALPVVDERGEPVGVLSRSDIVAHDCDCYRHLHASTEDAGDSALALHEPSTRGCEQSSKGDAVVGDIMNRVIYSVTPKTPAKSVIDGMLALGIHRLFVTDAQGKVLGVISSTDILRHLTEPKIVTFEDIELLQPRPREAPPARVKVDNGGHQG